MRYLIMQVICISLFTLRVANGSVTDMQENNVYITTEDGNEWCLEEVDDLHYRDEVRILFSTNGTESIYDDIILKYNVTK